MAQVNQRLWKIERNRQLDDEGRSLPLTRALGGNRPAMGLDEVTNERKA
jgi:hypothetical protein